MILAAFWLCSSVAFAVNGTILVRYSPDGEMEAERRWKDGTDWSTLVPMAIDNNNNVIICAEGRLFLLENDFNVTSYQSYIFDKIIFDSLNGYYLQNYNGIVKLNDALAQQWEIEMEAYQNIVEDCMIDKNDNLVMLVESNSSNVGLYKYNSAGQLQWKKAIDEQSLWDNYFYKTPIKLDNENSMYFLSYALVDGEVDSLNLNKFSADGILQWQLPIQNRLDPIVINNEENIIISVDTETSSSLEGELGEEYSLDRFHVYTYDFNGQPINDAYIGEPLYNRLVLFDVDLGSDGGIIISAVGLIGDEFYQKEFLYILKITSDGDVLWTYKYERQGRYYNNCANCRTIIDNDNNILVSGLSCGDNTDCNCILFKLDLDGNLLWNNNLPRCYSQDLPCNAALDEDDNIYLAGYYGYTDDDDDDDDDEPGCGCF